MTRTTIALWKRRSKKDKKFEFLTGIIDLGVAGSANVIIFQKKKKKKENYPDFYGKLSQPFVAPDEEEEKVTEETAF